MLVKYIRSKKHKLIDDRVPNIAILQDDPLGEILRTPVLHITQMGTYLHPQTLPVSLYQASALVIAASLYPQGADLAALSLPHPCRQYLIELGVPDTGARQENHSGTDPSPLQDEDPSPDN